MPQCFRWLTKAFWENLVLTDGSPIKTARGSNFDHFIHELTFLLSYCYSEWRRASDNFIASSGGSDIIRGLRHHHRQPLHVNKWKVVQVVWENPKNKRREAPTCLDEVIIVDCLAELLMQSRLVWCIVVKADEKSEKGSKKLTSLKEFRQKIRN